MYVGKWEQHIFSLSPFWEITGDESTNLSTNEIVFRAREKKTPLKTVTADEGS